MTDTITHLHRRQSAGHASGRYADVFNPALGEPCAKVALASTEEVDQAVAAAAAAFPGLVATRRRWRAPASCSSTCSCASSTPTNSPP